MTKEFEYLTMAVELDNEAPELIQNELNKLGRQGYVVVGTSHWGGFRSPKKVMYTLMRPKQPYVPSDTPNFNVNLKSKANTTTLEHLEALDELDRIMKQSYDERFPDSPFPDNTEPQ